MQEQINGCIKEQENYAIVKHAESILGGYLKTKPFGLKFRRQHPYSVYILDFYCHKLKLVIEVDGSIHYIDTVKEMISKDKRYWSRMDFQFCGLATSKYYVNWKK